MIFFFLSLPLVFFFTLRRFGKGNKRLSCHLPLNSAVGLRECRIIFAAAAGGGGTISRSVPPPQPSHEALVYEGESFLLRGFN